MKRILSVSVFSALLLMMASAAYASSIQLASYGSTASNPGVANTALYYNGFLPHNNNTNGVGPLAFGPSYNVSPGGVWAGPIPPNSSWVSNSPAGGPPNGGPANAAIGDYFYSTTFNIDPGNLDITSSYLVATISMLADDTMAVFVNGHRIQAFGNIGSDSHCADGQPTCGYPSTFDQALLTIAIPAADLKNGLNRISLVDWEAHGNSPSGVDFAATIGTPEPGSLLLLGTGLLGLALLMFKKLRSTPSMRLNM